MPEHIMWLLYGCVATVAAAIATVRTIGEWVQIKPFTCVYCMTVWCGLVFMLVYTPSYDLPTMLGVWAVNHFGAYFIYNKLA